jgi:hypothetical protein
VLAKAAEQANWVWSIGTRLHLRGVSDRPADGDQYEGAWNCAGCDNEPTDDEQTWLVVRPADPARCRESHQRRVDTCMFTVRVTFCALFR